MDFTKELWKQTLIERHGSALNRSIAAKTVAILGLGGLGSNVAITLVRLGFENLILVDSDRVDISNLHRQQYKYSQLGRLKTEAMRDNLLEINPYLNLSLKPTYIDESNVSGIIKSADFIVECFDGAASKSMLVNEFTASNADKFLITASGMAGIYSANLIKTKKLGRNIYLCGDGNSDVETEGTLYAPRVMLCASHQAMTVLRLAAGIKDV